MSKANTARNEKEFAAKIAALHEVLGDDFPLAPAIKQAAAANDQTLISVTIKMEGEKVSYMAVFSREGFVNLHTLVNDPVTKFAVERTNVVLFGKPEFIHGRYDSMFGPVIKA